MTLTQLSKVMQAARLMIQGSFEDYKHACTALNIPVQFRNRISDVRLILKNGCPELIAGVESGLVPLGTGWQLAKHFPHNEQRAAVERIERYRYHRNGDRPRVCQHGVYIGKRPDKRAERHERDIRQAVDNLLDAMMERAEAAVRVTGNAPPPAPDPTQARKWRRTIRHCRDALKQLEQQIDWTRTHERTELTTQEGGDGHHGNSNPNQGDGHNDTDSRNRSGQ